MTIEADEPDCCTTGRPMPRWHRFVPGFAWDAWWTIKLIHHDFSEGRRTRLAALADERTRRLATYSMIHLDRLDAGQKDRLIAAWREVLGIGPIKTRHLPYVGPDEREMNHP